MRLNCSHLTFVWASWPTDSWVESTESSHGWADSTNWLRDQCLCAFRHGIHFWQCTPSCCQCTWQYHLSEYQAENANSRNRSVVTYFTGRCDISHWRAISRKLLLTVQTEGNVDGTDVSDSLKVRDAGALELGGGRCIAHIYPADRLICIDEVHSHGLFGRNRVQSGRGTT